MATTTGICTECGQQATGKVMDFGIGPYEFWGAPGNDVQLALVSICCEADMNDECGNLLEYDPYDEEPF